MNTKPKYVILKGIADYRSFFCFNTSDDPTKLHNGEVAYVVLGYAETVREAQIFLYGEPSTEAYD